MNEKLLTCVVILSVVFLWQLLRPRRCDRPSENDAETMKSNFRILTAACSEIWMILYHREYPGLEKLNPTEVQNLFDGVLLSLTREEAFRLYVAIKQKLTFQNDELKNSAYSLIIRELSRRYGC